MKRLSLPHVLILKSIFTTQFIDLRYFKPCLNSVIYQVEFKISKVYIIRL